jgi:hypothetical protein
MDWRIDRQRLFNFNSEVANPQLTSEAVALPRELETLKFREKSKVRSDTDIGDSKIKL